MPERNQHSYPLLRQFREFYAEAARLKCMAEHPSSVSKDDSTASQLQYTLQPPIPIPPETAASAGIEADVPEASVPADMSVGVDSTVGKAWLGMAQYLDQKIYEANHAAGSFSFEVQRELVYIMAALADEIFLNLNWSGKDYWLDHLMEERLFHTQVAGQEIFRRIDRVFSRQDFAAEELAAVYLIALALGFKGQYWRDQDRDSIDKIRKKLLDRLLWSNPELQQGSSRMFPEAYQHTVDEGAPVKLPEPQTWWVAVVVIIGVWLIGSTIGWLWLTHSTRVALQKTSNSLDKIPTQTTKSPTTTGNQTKKPAAETVNPSGPVKVSVEGELPEWFWVAVAGVIIAGLILSVIAWRQRTKSKREIFERTLTALDDIRKHGQA